MDLTQYSKSDLATALTRAKGAIKRANEKTREITGRTINSGLSVAAGYGVGVLKNKVGDSDGRVLIPGTAVEADLALGVVMTAAGVTGLGGNRAEELCSIGSGLLAGYAAIAGYKHGLPGEGR